jgi:hypothetical protein
MLTPDWAHRSDWDAFRSCAIYLALDFVDSLPDNEHRRLINDDQFFELVGEQIQQKIVSVLETYRSKGMYAGTKAN